MKLRAQMIAVVISVALFSGYSFAGSDDFSCDYKEPYDFLVLAVQHKPGSCVSSSCNDFDFEWGIHGLWPTSIDQMGPESCCNVKFDEEILRGLKSELISNWSSSKGSSNERFWAYEWRKHGTCSKYSGFESQKQYFETALKLYRTLSPAMWLSPDKLERGLKYKISDISAAISEHFKQRVKLNCKNSPTGEDVLAELHFCFEPRTLAPVSCVATHYCNETITLAAPEARTRELVLDFTRNNEKNSLSNEEFGYEFFNNV